MTPGERILNCPLLSLAQAARWCGEGVHWDLPIDESALDSTVDFTSEGEQGPIHCP